MVGWTEITTTWNRNLIHFETMERLAIIDHKEHRLYIEDVTDEELAKYNGDEQEYIEDNYNFLCGEYSWDYIVDSVYIDCNDPDPREMNIKKSIG